MSDRVLIREAQPDELEAVEALVKESYGEFHALVPAEAWEGWMKSIAQSVHSGAGLLLVAEVEGGLRGVVQFFPDASRSGQGRWPAEAATIRLLAVRPDFRVRGLGTRLTRECLRLAREEQIPTIYLYTGRFMLAAQHIYEKLGFQRAPEYEPPEPGPIAYRLDLITPPKS
jgi:ribosomal protein S18 acetylase RimI-like enzyme